MDSRKDSYSFCFESCFEFLGVLFCGLCKDMQVHLAHNIHRMGLGMILSSRDEWSVMLFSSDIKLIMSIDCTPLTSGITYCVSPYGNPREAIGLRLTSAFQFHFWYLKYDTPQDKNRLRWVDGCKHFAVPGYLDTQCDMGWHVTKNSCRYRLL